MLIVVVPAAAICMLLLNLAQRDSRAAASADRAPARVAEDEAELHPAPLPTPTNPWDEPQ